MRRVFLGIGVNDYDDGRYKRLSGAISDAAKMRAFFEREMPPELRFERAELLANPTSDEAAERIEDALSALEDDSVFVFYFAGHGLSRNGKQMLLCRDALACLAEGVDATGYLPLGYMRSVSLRGKGDMFFCYDVCRSDVAIGSRGVLANIGASQFRDATSERFDARLGGAGSHWSLLSCGDGQRATDDGAFVDALLDEMRATLAQGRELKLCDELVEGVTRRLGATRRRPESRGVAFVLAPRKNAAREADERTDAKADDALHPPAQQEERDDRSAPKTPFWSFQTLKRFLFPRRGRAAGARKLLTIEGVEVAFRWAPPGRFVMGSPENEDGRDRCESQREVVVPNGFWLAETPTTQLLWKRVMGVNPSRFQGDDLRPVERVSWLDCREFVEKLNALRLPDVDEFRLPSEEEWEYACRAGSRTAFPWGDALNGDRANCDGRTPCGATANGVFLGETTRAGRYPANRWGLFDMNGNVYEWCDDASGDRASNDSNSATEPRDVSLRVLRGGAWMSVARCSRSAYKLRVGSDRRFETYGCRLLIAESERA